MQKTNSKAFLVILLGVLSAFGPFVVDLYLPSLPQLAQFFDTTAFNDTINAHNSNDRFSCWAAITWADE